MQSFVQVSFLFEIFNFKKISEFIISYEIIIIISNEAKENFPVKVVSLTDPKSTFLKAKKN